MYWHFGTKFSSNRLCQFFCLFFYSCIHFLSFSWSSIFSYTIYKMLYEVLHTFSSFCTEFLLVWFLILWLSIWWHFKDGNLMILIRYYDSSGKSFTTLGNIFFWRQSIEYIDFRTEIIIFCCTLFCLGFDFESGSCSLACSVPLLLRWLRLLICNLYTKRNNSFYIL